MDNPLNSGAIYADRLAARMISPVADQGVGTRASFVRKVFDLASIPPSAVLKISALGLYRAFINGQRVGKDLLTPGWTVYTQRLSFQTYNVGDLLREGDNTIEIWLGDGWMRSPLGWEGAQVVNTWGDTLGAIAELSSGSRVLLGTDATWSSGLLPVLKSGIYFGEIYDAREEGADAEQGVELVDFDQNRLIPHEADPVRELEPLPVVASFADDAGRTVYDFGQNSAGYVRFTVKGDVGARVIVEHAEILDQDGQFYNGNLRIAEARLEYVLKGGEQETYSPTFTFQGFRYARVAIEGRAVITTIASVPISSVAELTAGFVCGDELVNRLFANTIWSTRSNFIEAPTDCPQRDERLGWTGDAQVFAPTACYLFDVQNFFKKWIRDVMADQREDGAIAHVTPDIYANGTIPNFYGSTGWGDAIVIIPWVLYEHYGDKEFLRECLPAMVRWNEYVWSISDGPIVRPPRTWDKHGFTFGDWLQPYGADTRKPLPTMGDDAAATIYLYISSHLTSRIADIVGDGVEARRLSARAETVRQAFQDEFISRTGRLGYDDQSSYALAFQWDLIPDAHRDQAARYFKSTIERSEGRIGTGFIGTPALLPALVKSGQPGLAASLFLQQDVPGWLAQVRRGATTIWERWDGIREDGSIFEPSMNSYNHYAFGAVCQWLLEGVAGFRPDPQKPAFRSIIFEPTIVPELSPVSAFHEAASGRIEAGWEVKDNTVTYSVTVPEGARGTLILAAKYTDITVNQIPLARASGEKARSQLAPGTHSIVFRISQQEQ